MLVTDAFNLACSLALAKQCDVAGRVVAQNPGDVGSYPRLALENPWELGADGKPLLEHHMPQQTYSGHH